MKKMLTLLLLLAVPVMVTGRAVRAWSYQEMFEQADVVVIAKPISTKDTEEKGGREDFSQPYAVIAVATAFETRVVMKGDKATNKFVLHHYRLAQRDGPVVNGPNFVAFDPKAHQCFLLFLKEESDGRYTPVTGQRDPALFSVIKNWKGSRGNLLQGAHQTQARPGLRQVRPAPDNEPQSIAGAERFRSAYAGKILRNAHRSPQKRAT